MKKNIYSLVAGKEGSDVFIVGGNSVFCDLFL